MITVLVKKQVTHEGLTYFVGIHEVSQRTYEALQANYPPDTDTLELAQEIVPAGDNNDSKEKHEPENDGEEKPEPENDGEAPTRKKKK